MPKEFTVNLTTSDFKVNNAGNAFNVATQIATETTPTVAFGKTSLSNLGTLKVNNKDYVYVAMNYIFAKEDVDVEFNIATEAHGTVNTSISNVPVAKNYKTNIVGNLLTSNVSYEVTLDDNWDGAAHEVKIWDGETLAVPQYDADTKTWTINNGEELAWIANAVYASDGTNVAASLINQAFAKAGGSDDHTLINAIEKGVTQSNQEITEAYAKVNLIR